MNEPRSPDPAAPEKKSRLGCIVVGIVIAFLAVLLICGGIVGVGMVGLFTAIKSSDPYTESLSRAQANTELIENLGEPIDAGFIVQGNINLNNDDGQAELNYSVSGPKGSAQVHVVGTKTDGTWNYQTMDATLDGAGEVFDLRETKSF